MKIRQAEKILDKFYDGNCFYRESTFLKADKTYKKILGFEKWSKLL